MAALLVSLPMQLACQIICAADSTDGNLTFVPSTPIYQQNVSTLPEGYVAFPDIGIAYKYHSKEVTWDEARNRCIEYGATLAVVDSFKTHDYIMTVKPNTAHVYIGIHKFYNGRDWTSIKTGRAVSLVPWAPGEPQGPSSVNCGAMWNDGRGLSAERCDEKRHFLCEIPIRTNNN